MPIYNLNKRNQMVGKAGNIRKGIKEPVIDKKTGKPKINDKGEIVTRPMEVDYFVFKPDEADHELTKQVDELYGKTKKFVAFLATSDKGRAWDYWFEAYNFSQLIARSDGNIVTFLFDTATQQKIIDNGRIVEVPTKETPVTELLSGMGVGGVLGYYDGMVVARTQAGDPVCFDAKGRLNIILRDLGRQLTWTVHTGGLYGDVPHITEMVDIIEDLSRAMNIPAPMVPFSLTRYEVSRKYTGSDGKKHRRAGWDIRMEVLPEFFTGVLEVYQKTPIALAATNPQPIRPESSDYVETESEWDGGLDEPGAIGPEPDDEIIGELVSIEGSKAVSRQPDVPVITPQFLVDEQVVKTKELAGKLISLLMIDGADVTLGKARIYLFDKWRKLNPRNDDQTRKFCADKAIAGEIPPEEDKTPF